MMLAGQDKIVGNGKARDFYSHSKTPAAQKQIKLFPDAYHELHKEPKYKLEVYEAIYGYIAKRIS